MKERSKEQLASLLMEELLGQFTERENIKRMLGDLVAQPVDQLIEKLLEDFEGAIALRRQLALEQEKLSKEEAATKKRPSTLPGVDDLPRTPPVSARHTVAAGAPEPGQGIANGPLPMEGMPAVPTLTEPEPQKKNGDDGPSFTRQAPLTPESDRRTAEGGERESIRHTPIPPVETSDKEFSEQLVKAFQRAQERLDADRTESEHAGEEKPLDIIDHVHDAGTSQHDADQGVQIEKPQLPRIPYKLEEDDVLYIHAVTKIPEGESPSPEPFLLEEKGIDGLNFAVALDHQGLRYYVSKIRPGIMNVSKNGMLLLNKQESLQRLGAHESILNDLRIHGILLPIEFGTVARGTDELFSKLDYHSDNIKEVLDVVFSTSWWMLNLYVLDVRIAQLVGSGEIHVRRERDTERASYTAVPQATRYDFKAMERILSREKKIAESIHEELGKVSERSDIDQIADLGSSLSEDWKLILKASYKVTGRGTKAFFKAIVDLQYRHVIYDPMLAVTGDLEFYSFKTK